MQTFNPSSPHNHTEPNDAFTQNAADAKHTHGTNSILAIPTDLPAAPDLSNIPAHVLHTGTIETLIGQNDDLMARLKVNIRRNSTLEQQIMAHERTQAQLMSTNSSLMSQLQILEEKELILREKTNRTDQIQNTLKEEVEFLQSKIGVLETRVMNLKKSERFARRVRRWVRPMIDRLQFEATAKSKDALKKDAMMSDLRARVVEAGNVAKAIERQYSKDQAKLVENHESAIRSALSEVERLRSEVKLLRDKAERVDQLTRSEAEARNKIILLERQTHEALKSAELARREAKQNEDAKNLLDDQFHSLKAVWSETQKRLEISVLQNETLNRLNQELSRHIKDQKDHKQDQPQAIHAKPEITC